MRVYLTGDGYGFAHTHDVDAARELGARTGLDVLDRCGGGAGVDDRDGARVEAAARAVAAERGMRLEMTCARCVRGDCARHVVASAVEAVAADRWHRDAVLPAVERMVDAYTAHGGSL